MPARLLFALLLFAACTARAVDTLQFDEKPFAALSNADFDDNGKIALAVRPAAWHHGESPHFILHYRRITEAKRVALEIEYHIAFIAKTLNAGPERYAHKSHVFIFEDENDWGAFLKQTTMPAWFASFAVNDQLFLNVREGRTGMFNSQTLAHETTHAVVARLYPHVRWPLWLSEGFAEQMSGLSVGARMGQYNPRLLNRLQAANLPLDQLTTMTEYPAEPLEVSRLYQSGERLTRFLMTNAPPGRFIQLINALTSGKTLETAVMKLSKDRYPTWAEFQRRYEMFK